jgi:tRNA-dihydrouridine synthase B
MTHSFSPLQIGPLRIDFPVIQAALSGYSDWPMRVIAKRLGAPFTICEVLLDKFILDVTKSSKAKRFLRVSDEEHPCAAQLMGAVPEQFAPAAIKLVEAGFDAIDLNFACPVKKVLGRCRGGFLLSRPEIALEIVARVRDVLPENVPLTVKMRRGMDDSTHSLDNFYEIFDGAYRLGAAAITVHGRTVRQRYEGVSSWQFLNDIKRRAGHNVVIGSGDLFIARDCLNMFKQTGVDGVAVARGAIGNPWIFQQIRELAEGHEMPPPGLHRQREVIAEHYRLAGEIYGERRCCALMRKFGIKYSRMHPQAAQVRDAFIAVKEPEDWREVLEKWYTDDLPGVWPTTVDQTYYSQ